MPTNYPVQFNSGSVQPVDEMLTTCDDSPQVLPQTWVFLEELEHLSRFVDLSLLDVQVFSLPGIQFVCTLSYFEGYLLQLAAEQADLPSIADLDAPTADRSAEEDRLHELLNVEWIPSFGQRVELKDRVLAAVKPLQLQSLESVCDAAGIRYDLAQGGLDASFKSLDLAICIHDCLAHGEVGSMSQVSSTSDVIARAGEFTHAPYATFLLLNSRWELVVSIEKRTSLAEWNGVTLKRGQIEP